MSELKAYTFDNMLDGVADVDIEYYPKLEADKVIAELEESHKMEVEQLLMEIVELKKEKEYVIEHTAEVINGQEKELLRHKYKRCVELADSCAFRAIVAKMENRRFPTPKNSWRMILYPKWYKRWLAIAEQFKTNSSAQ